MLRERARGGDRAFVAPEREGEDLAGLAQAFEALDGEEAIDLVEPGPEARGEVEIGAAPSFAGKDLEDDGDHGAGRIGVRKLRSSLRMKRSLYAMARLAAPSGSDLRRAR